MNIYKILPSFFFFALSLSLYSQEVPILNYTTNSDGQVELTVESTEDNYYLLSIRHGAAGEFASVSSMTLGTDTTTVISEPLQAYPESHYQVWQYDINSPKDVDLDGVNDISEFNDLPNQSPLNHAESIPITDGAVGVNSAQLFNQLSVTGDNIPWAVFLNDKEFTKFLILNIDTDKPELYFINSNTHYIHQDFANTIGVFDVYASNVLTGEIIYHPEIVSDNGNQGVYSFNYSFGYGKQFSAVQKTHELIAANMPFLDKDLSYYITNGNENSYLNDQPLFENSRISILSEDAVFEDVDYLALNVAEGFGLLRLMDLEETPGSRDVVLYEALPNTLPRVGGIITSFIQTPLSHVNLRAIQDNVPNSFIRDPLDDETISNLIGKYVYYKVEQNEYFIREATIDEVNQWYEDIRPTEEQTPILNLDYQDILPLDDIEFKMSDGFGAKCANVATMRTFGFAEGTVPDGFGVPFYFYQEFMNYNGFFEEVELMIADEDFKSDLQTRVDMLKDFRKKIKSADMPQWMLDDLQDMHDLFPEGTAVRCRSSTNNEDLPGFSGAGLYTSKTQHLDEGHISKSIKQVYASMWNFRAYEERDFYRVNHYVASMGVLCHPNFSNEYANGVGVSTDPIYLTEGTFYLNTQVGEDLVTNPEAMSIPEEILLDREGGFGDGISVIRYSNLTGNSQLIMDPWFLYLMRMMLNTIHDEFQILYNAEGNDEFAMDIEYKITDQFQLVIKQARPWASYWSELEDPTSSIDIAGKSVEIYPNPVSDYLTLKSEGESSKIRITNSVGQVMFERNTGGNPIIQLSTNKLTRGIYFMNGIGANGQIFFTKKFIKE